MIHDWTYIFNNHQTAPDANLALEEYALRNLADRNYMMLYCNEASVVLGRNQNPLEEINLGFAYRNNIPVLRRISGGGTVFHHPGNLNFSFITDYKTDRLHNFRFFNEPVVQLLRQLGVPAEMNDRNDILADGRKISGSAQFSSRGRMISHGTLLFDAPLDQLDELLTVQNKDVHSRSHKSVRSRVANISGFLDQQMDISEFRTYLTEGLTGRSGLQDAWTPGEADNREVESLRRNRYTSWEWNYGRSPRFYIDRSEEISGYTVSMQLCAEKGSISETEFAVHDLKKNLNGETGQPEISRNQLQRTLAGISSLLVNKRYEPVTIMNTVQSCVSETLASTAQNPEKGRCASASQIARQISGLIYRLETDFTETPRQT